MSNRYVPIAYHILTSDKLSDGAIRTYAMIMSYAFDKVSCYPTYAELEEKLGKKRNALSKHVAELKQFGVLKVYTHKRNNIYVIMPPEWVTLEETDGEIKTLDEFNELVATIKKYYAELDKPKRAKRKPSASRVSKVEEVRQKIESGNHTYTTQELAYAFEVMNYDIRGKTYRINAGRDYAIIQTMFGKQDTYGEIELRIMRKYITMYDVTFSSARFKEPSIANLSVGFIFNKVVELVRQDLQREERQSAQICDEVF